MFSHFRILLISTIISTFAFADLMFTGIMDGPLSGGTPKVLELYASSDISDLSEYTLVRCGNGGACDDSPTVLPAESVSANSFIYITGTSSNVANFQTWFGFDADYSLGVCNGNGDDAYALLKSDNVVDRFGVEGVDGTGESWEYLDGWAYRNDNTAAGDFVDTDWSYSGTNALDGEADNATAATPFPLGTYTPPAAAGCTDVSDCDDSNDYTADSCVDGSCVHDTLECLSDADCSDAACNTAACDLNNNTCVQTPVADATACDDGDGWTENDVCTSGACAGTALSTVDVTFNLDMSTQSSSAPEIRIYYGCLANCDGPYDSSVDQWLGNEWIAMDDADGDGVWSYTTALATGVDYTYAYSNDVNGSFVYEDQDFGVNDCGTDGTYGNRRHVTPGDADMALDAACWSSCSACPDLQLCGDVTCVASGDCYVAGTCDDSTGLCSDETFADAGVSCDDADANTSGDVCDGAGSCAGVASTTHTYDWSDGGTVLGIYGNVGSATNVNGVLELVESPLSSTPQAYLSYVQGLSDGDEVTACFDDLDTTPDGSPSLRIWATYLKADGSYGGSAGGNSTYSGAGVPLCHTWTYDSDSGERTVLNIQTRLYSGSGDGENIFYVDNLSVTTITTATVQFPAPPADPCAGVDCSGNDTACTTSSCVDGSCVDTNVADGTACDDGNGSTTGDVCTAGTCAGTVPTYTVTFDIDGLDDCDQVNIHGSWDSWSGWSAHPDNNMTVDISAGDYEFVILCVDHTDATWDDGDAPWWDAVVENSVTYNAPIGGSCWNGNNEYANYTLSVDSDVTVSYCAGTCDATCAVADVEGCMDANADNYNADATVQTYDQYGNLSCVYASCDVVPEDGCIYADGFGVFNEWFNADNCVTYGGTPCESSDDPTPSDVTFTIDGLDDCVYASITGSFGTAWNGWGTALCDDGAGNACEASNSATVSLDNGSYDFQVVCVPNGTAGEWGTVIDGGGWSQFALTVDSGDCWNGNSTYPNYTFTVAGADLTVAHCAGSCDATCGTADPCADVTCDLGYSCDATGSCVADVDPCDGVTCDTNELCDATGTCVIDCSIHDSGVVFSGDFGGAYDCGNSYIIETGSEVWAGFANEDTSLYPFSFPNGGTVTFTGSALDADVGVVFKFEHQPFPNVDPNFSTAAVTVSGSTPTAYSVDIPAQPADQTFSSFLLYLVELDRYVTLTDVTVNGSVALVTGCMDSNASNYDPTATVQAEDQYGNLLCSFGSCDELLVSYPDGACLYGLGNDDVENHVGLYQLDVDPPFGPTECEVWGTACLPPVSSQPDNLFFSEWAEGSSNNKYWELYNATNATVDLADYEFVTCSNECTDYEYNTSFSDGASVAAGDVYVVCHSQSTQASCSDATYSTQSECELASETWSASIFDECDQTNNYVSNGDDALGLLHVPSNTLLDRVGTPGDGSTSPNWDVAGVAGATANHTLVRKNTVTQGNTDWAASAGTTDEDSEWVVLESDTWTYLGSHPHSFDTLCDDATACDYLDSGDCVFANTGEDCDGNAIYTLTFSVNMSYAGDIDTENGVRVFGSWGTAWSSNDAISATCDDNDVCTASITLPAGDYLYKFRNGWSYEDLDNLSCAIFDDPDGDGFGYWNRTATLSGDSNLDTVCFGVCADCIGGCTDSSASNTDDNANVDDGSCEYAEPVANLFFSEYAEGSSNNKYLEIYNASNDTVTLGNYAYPNANGGSDGTHNYWNAFDDGASVAAGGVYVICHGSFAGDQTLCDEFHNYLSNGDDGYCLVFGPDDGYEVLDCIGDFGADPGSGWDVAGVNDATKDHTLVRKSDVTTGNDGYWEASAGTEDDDSEWHVLDKDTWTFLGSHPHTLVYGCTDVAANNTNDSANVDDGSCTYPLSLTLETCSSASSVRMTGTWWGWDPNGGPVAVDNGDGSWTVTFDPAPDADMEYLWVVDGVQEALFDNAANGECTALIDNGTLVTDYANWGNRWWLQDGNRTDVYDSCSDECQYTVSFTADMNCADYTPVSGDVVHVKGLNTDWNGVFTDLSDDDGDGVWTGSGTVPAGTWEWKLTVGHWTDDSWWNTWHAQEDLAGLSCATQVPDTNYWNRVTVVTDSDVSESVTYGSCTACASCSDLTCESWESCADVVYTDPVCECTDNGGNVNGLGDINVTDIVALVGWILGCSGDATCFTAEQICNGDLNGDGAVNVNDVISLVNTILADRISYDDATSANIVLTNKTISVNSNGFVAGVQMTLSHGSDFSLDLKDSYVSEYSTIGNKTTLLLVAIDNSLEEIATYKGSFEVESVILCNSNDEISDVNVINVNSIEVKLAGPNPFNPSTSLNIVVAQDGFVSVNVYNLIGQKVATLLNGYMDANLNGYPVNFNGSNLASGVYLVRAETAGNVSTQKLMLLK